MANPASWLSGARSTGPRSLALGWAVPGDGGAAPGLGGGVRLVGGDGGPPAGGFLSTSGKAASAGALPGVNLGCCVGAGLPPLSNVLPGAPGAGVDLPAGDVTGLPGGVPLGANVARGVAAGEIIPRGMAAGEAAPANRPSAPALRSVIPRPVQTTLPATAQI